MAQFREAFPACHMPSILIQRPAKWGTPWAALKRRRLNVLASLVILLCATGIRAETPIVGAIRWDAWQENGTANSAVEATLGPEHWHYRLPFFSQVISTSSVNIDCACPLD